MFNTIHAPNGFCQLCGATLDSEIDDNGNVLFIYCPNWISGSQHP